MANIDTQAMAIQVVKENFEKAQKSSRIGKKVTFDPRRVKEISAGQGLYKMVYTRPDGKPDRRIRQSHPYPSLMTNRTS